MLYLAANRRASRSGAFAGLWSVCFIKPISDVLLSVKIVTLDDFQRGPHVKSANLIASILYMLMSNRVLVGRVIGIANALEIGMVSGLKGPAPGI
jgi:hypothetical protein